MQLVTKCNVYLYVPKKLCNPEAIIFEKIVVNVNYAKAKRRNCVSFIQSYIYVDMHHDECGYTLVN